MSKYINKGAIVIESKKFEDLLRKLEKNEFIYRHRFLLQNMFKVAIRTSL